MHIFGLLSFITRQTYAITTVAAAIPSATTSTITVRVRLYVDAHCWTSTKVHEGSTRDYYGGSGDLDYNSFYYIRMNRAICI